MSTSLNAVASSSKRPAPPTATSSASNATPAKRPRPSSNKAESVADEMSEDEGEGDDPLDEATRAKIARKEARVSHYPFMTFYDTYIATITDIASRRFETVNPLSARATNVKLTSFTSNNV